MLIFENLTGARMHTALFSFGGINFNLSFKDLQKIIEFNFRLKGKILEIYELLNYSKI